MCLWEYVVQAGGHFDSETTSRVDSSVMLQADSPSVALDYSQPMRLRLARDILSPPSVLLVGDLAGMKCRWRQKAGTTDGI